MWSPEAGSRRFLLIGLSSLLASCGFVPAYGPGGSGAALHNRVAIEAPGTEAGWRLQDALIARLGRAPAAAWLLEVEPQVTATAAAVTREGDLTRQTLVGRVDYRLTDPATGRLLAEGSVDAFAGLSTTGSTVATRAAEQDAQERLAVELADLLVTRLLSVPLPE